MHISLEREQFHCEFSLHFFSIWRWGVLASTWSILLLILLCSAASAVSEDQPHCDGGSVSTTASATAAMVHCHKDHSLDDEMDRLSREGAAAAGVDSGVVGDAVAATQKLAVVVLMMAPQEEEIQHALHLLIHNWELRYVTLHRVVHLRQRSARHANNVHLMSRPPST